jgi:hypothetical protein
MASKFFVDLWRSSRSLKVPVTIRDTPEIRTDLDGYLANQYRIRPIWKPETGTGYPVQAGGRISGRIFNLKGQSHEKVGEMSVWGISLGPN